MLTRLGMMMAAALLVVSNVDAAPRGGGGAGGGAGRGSGGGTGGGGAGRGSGGGSVSRGNSSGGRTIIAGPYGFGAPATLRRRRLLASTAAARLWLWRLLPGYQRLPQHRLQRLRRAHDGGYYDQQP